MYRSYWNLVQRPFENISDPEFFVECQSHQAALLKLKYIVEHDHGAGILAGPVGAGKTCIANQLCHDLGDQAGPYVRVLFPQMSATELMHFILAELAQEPVSDAHPIGLDRVVRQLDRELQTLCESDRHPLIVIDDAHLIDDPAVFEAFRQLLNFNEQPNRRISIILAGDPALLSRIQRHRQLDERIGVRAVVPALEADETRRYIKTRLEVAGCERSLFSDAATQAIFRLSGGLPRRINRLCEMSLLVGYADGLAEITDREVEALAPEVLGAAA